jgi:hypothetical protein
MSGGVIDRLEAVARFLDIEAPEREPLPPQLTDVRRVVDDQDALGTKAGTTLEAGVEVHGYVRADRSCHHRTRTTNVKLVRSRTSSVGARPESPVDPGPGGVAASSPR